MMKAEDNNQEKSLVKEEEFKVGWDDILAIMIAQFQVLFPIALGFVAIIILLLLLIMKVWLKQ
jgi:hypothetical protein